MRIRKNRLNFSFVRFDKSLAYLLGVYLGDGAVIHCPKTGNRIFRLRSIDEEFVDRTICEVLSVLPNVEYTKRQDNSAVEKPNRRLVHEVNFGVIGEQLWDWLEFITNKKKIFPYGLLKESPEESQIGFFEGLFDGEGYILKAKSKSHKSGFRYTLGIAMASDWLEEVIKLTKRLGVENWNKCRTEPTRKGTTMYVMRTSLHSATGMKFKFTAKRKSERFEDFLKLLNPQRLHAIPQLLQSKGEDIV